MIRLNLFKEKIVSTCIYLTNLQIIINWTNFLNTIIKIREGEWNKKGFKPNDIATIERTVDYTVLFSKQCNHYSISIFKLNPFVIIIFNSSRWFISNHISSRIHFSVIRIKFYYINKIVINTEESPGALLGCLSPAIASEQKCCFQARTYLMVHGDAQWTNKKNLPFLINKQIKTWTRRSYIVI